MDVSDPALLDATELLSAYRARALTPLAALQAVTERIARRNPDINAFSVMNPEALDAARASTARWAANAPTGALDGVPVTVKDFLDVKALPTRRGSKATSAAPATNDAPVVEFLRAAGAVIVGKTTAPEFGWKIAGDSPLTGVTRNPWDKTRDTGGSSAGAAAAAAAFFGPLHVATDAYGSIRLPAAWCGVVGMKPSFGLTPQWPLGAFGHVGAAGPIARTVKDAALLLETLAGYHKADPFSLDLPKRDYTATLEDGVAGLKIGILRHPGFAATADDEQWQALDQARHLLEAQGAVISEVTIDLPDISELLVTLWGIAQARQLALIAPERHADLDPLFVETARKFQGISGLELIDAEAKRLRAAHAMAALGVDGLLCPAVPHAAPLAKAPLPDPVHALVHDWAPWSFLFNLTRQPAVTLPIGVNTNNLPLAVQVAAPLYRDEVALKIARALERMLG
ncbi:amidase family protein [Acidocella sp.]|uniref:amidase family protein n=1 Tax=Acidocella sp. TaxID=50710 RepID=UPI0026135D92|nr:amidase family protein [Acidocella sp.]